ncbi:MAG: SIMPL domain-containing protein [Bacillota bacterium]
MYKKSFLILTLAAMILLVFTAAAFAGENAPGPNMINVTGSGVVKTAPDVADITFAVITEAPQAEGAQAENARLTAKVLEALHNSGISKEDVVTLNYSLFPRHVYQEKKPPQISGYEARNEIRVTVRDTALVGKIIDVAVKNGANQVRSVVFRAENSLAQKIEALRQAITEARTKADVIVAALGKKIVGVKSATGTWHDDSPPPIIYEKATGLGSSVPISPGQVEVRATVEIVYIIE